MATRLTALDILERLVAFPTVSRESNLALVDWVEGYLAGHGIAARRVWNEGRTKAALYAQAGPAAAGGVALSGHSDVVPVDGQPWTTDPWRLTARDGRLHGRGAVDMKGFDALAIAALVAAAGRPLARPLQLALSYDEELGCTGAPPMIAALRADLPPAAAVIVGEPSMLRPVTAHKGSCAFNVHVRGHEVHSSRLPEGVSAIMEAARLVGWANAMNAANAAAAPAFPAAAAFAPPWTTLHVGLIEGGTAQNITARDCHMTVEIRVVPGEDPAGWEARLAAAAGEIAAGMRRVHPAAGIAIETFFRVPPLVPERDGAAEALLRRLTGDRGHHVVSYGTEAGQFQAAGFSAVVCGPGDIAQAHQPDEFITLAQFEAGEALLARLIDDLAP